MFSSEIHPNQRNAVYGEHTLYAADIVFMCILCADYGQHRLYIGGDAYSAPAVYVKEDDTWRLYFICRDYLGSITHIVHANGRLIAEYSYDAWGRLRNPETQEVYESGMEPTLFLGRGYTGHEHLPWFGLINMNARLYDPALGRFLAPDPYVQAPDFTQNFNRYSYCLNNPLKYADTNGEWVQVAIGAFIGGLSNWIANGGDLSWSGLAYFGVGAAVGALSSIGGALIASYIKAVGIWAGAGIGAGMGAGMGGASSFLLNGGNNMLRGDDFLKNWGGNLLSGVLGGALSGAISGGFSGYKNAKELGANPWTGNKVLSSKNYSAAAKLGILKQEDPEKHCYAVAGEYADFGRGNLTRDAFLCAAEREYGKIPDAANFEKVAQAAGLKTDGVTLGSIEIVQFANQFERGTIEGVLTIGTNPQAGHVVNLVSFSVEEKLKLLGGGSKYVIRNIKVWDPISAKIVSLVDPIMRFSCIKY